MRALLFASLALTVLAGAGLAAEPSVEVSLDLHHDTSPAMRDLPAATLRSPDLQTTPKALPWRRTTNDSGALAPGSFTLERDTALQDSAGLTLVAVAGRNLAGVGQGFAGPQGRFAVSSAPPDTNGAVGDTQIVEWVNQSYAVFDKATGKVLAGPIDGNALWSGFGGGCQSNNDGDPIVLFDKASHRWVFTQFSISSQPFLQCVAVSETRDATGKFYRYSFKQPNFNDYPKLGTWPDAFYITYNMFSGKTYVGPRACAMDRARMLTGAAATQECFQLGSGFHTILPADVDGATPPPAGAANPMLSFGANALLLWSFHADFATPAKARLTGPVNLKVAAFTSACAGSGGICIPQKQVGQKLDSLSDRLMFRLAYRHFAAATPPHESLVVTHSVAAPGTASAVRWYELRSPGAHPVVFQQGTFSPDATTRWMGSAAMDKVGDMLMGYSASSAKLDPSIRVSGRRATDPSGKLQAETSVFAGSGAQVSLSRWGDYTAMSVDPSDDCTFWYFNQYQPATGSFNWATRAASFKFPGCR